MQPLPLYPEPGRKLGDFIVREEIARGGFGAVFRARQLRLDRDVAVKVLMPEVVDANPDLRARFLREIDLVSRLEHPNIVVLHDFGDDDGLLWMAMEYVRGITLHKRIREQPLAPPDAKKIVLQVLSALVVAHDQQIVHRDLKPGNIMLTEVGVERDIVKLLDFGIGKAIGGRGPIHDLTDQGEMGFGTPRYMAPEQMLNKDVGPHTDVYSMGLILFEMLLGRPAVEGDSNYEILAKQTSQPLVLPSALEDTPLGDLITKAVSKQWWDRFASAREFYRALEELDVAGMEPIFYVEEELASSSTLTPVLRDTNPDAQAYDGDATQREPLSAPALAGGAAPARSWLIPAAVVGVAFFILLLGLAMLVTAGILWPERVAAPPPAAAETSAAPEPTDDLEGEVQPDEGGAGVEEGVAAVDDAVAVDGADGGTADAEGLGAADAAAEGPEPKEVAAAGDAKPAPAAVEKEAEYCSVSVNTGKVNASVTVDGRKKCSKTPCSFRLPRQHKVIRATLQAAGFHPKSVNIDLSKAKAFVRATLVRKI